MPGITVQDLTESTLDGAGVFDEMMKAVSAHVYVEYEKGRIKGTDYSRVYLEALNSTMDRAVEFLLNKDKVAQEAENLRIRGEILELEKQKAAVEIQLASAQRDNLLIENQLLQNQVINARAEEFRILAQTTLLHEQAADTQKSKEVKDAQICKLKAEFDVLEEQKLKTAAETAVLNQKKATEQAQTDGTAVNPESVIGKQMVLYQSQSDGFKRDAEQKATKQLIDTWNVRRTTDDGTIASDVNKLDDVTIGRAVNKLLEGINA